MSSIEKAPEPRVLDDLFMHEVINNAPPGSRFLDLGCGGGSFNYSDHPDIVFFPADKACFLPETTPPKTKARFVQLNSCCLPYKDNSFDGCFCNFVLEHVAHPEDMLKEVFRVLDKDALFYASIPNHRSWEDRIYRRFYPGDHIQKYTFKSFLELVYFHTGFKLISFCDWPAGHSYLANKNIFLDAVHVLLFCFFWIVKKVFGKDLVAESNYIILFRKEEKAGLRRTQVICRKCGARPFVKNDEPVFAEGDKTIKWKCHICDTTNIRV